MSVSQRHIPGASGPHANQPVLFVGPDLKGADAALILVHGRGASADGMFSIYTEIASDRIVALAPQASGNTWYPNSFLAPIESNQPYLDSALSRLASIIEYLKSQNVPTNRIALLGFSQGACLTLEFVARNPARYGAVIGLTGGLIGPPNTPRNYAGSLDGTPVFLGTSDPDPHVPVERVEETQTVLNRMGAAAELRTYRGMPHAINEEELNAARELIGRMQKTPINPA